MLTVIHNELEASQDTIPQLASCSYMNDRVSRQFTNTITWT